MAAQITSSFLLDYASQAPFFSTHCKHLIECRDKRKADFVLGPCLDYLSESESPGQTISCESWEGEGQQGKARQGERHIRTFTNSPASLTRHQRIHAALPGLVSHHIQDYWFQWLSEDTLMLLWIKSRSKHTFFCFTFTMTLSLETPMHIFQIDDCFLKGFDASYVLEKTHHHS